MNASYYFNNSIGLKINLIYFSLLTFCNEQSKQYKTSENQDRKK